tara:strand:- start:981 stop:1415 length:435 start_codon:yes stop_codon:yes gene_type:complete
MAVKIKDSSFIKYQRAMQTINSQKVIVGLFASAGDEVLTKATVNEFGTRNIPERSFIRSTYNKNYKKVAGRFIKIAQSISRGNYAIKNKMKLIGLEQEKAIKDTITNLRTPQNAPSTVAKKGSSNPLVDTGEMRSKISSALRNK